VLTGRLGEDESVQNSDCRLLGYDAVCTGGNVPTSQCNVLPAP